MMASRFSVATEGKHAPASTTEAFLPFSAPWFGPEEKQELIKALESDWITTGPRVKALEVAFSDYLGCQESVAVSSCTAALHLALAALGIGSQDAIITSPFTFAATANVIVHRGAQPVFVDIRPDTYNIDPQKVQAFIEERCEWNADERALRIRTSQRRVRAIIPVHYAGHPCDMEALNQLARQFGIKVIEDAAHALGASYRGQKVGTLGDVACFSFYPTKNITTGEGGMLTTNDVALAQRVRVLSLHGISRDAWRRYSQEGSWQYDVEDAGFKYNLTDLAAALGIHQLRKLDHFIRRRAQLAAQYGEELAGLPLQRPTVLPDLQPAWHLYAVQVSSPHVTRNRLIEELKRRNIGTSVHFLPLHLTSYYQRAFGYKAGDFPVAEEVFRHILSLPLFPRMWNEDLERVVRSLRESLTSLKSTS
ncbi:MAG: DegT/DnrJ/EryC1/StrS family aminotransferase [Terriglobia bacterium]